MKAVIRKMDRAIKRLYNLDHALGAESYLIKEPILPATGQGALFIQENQDVLQVGIFLDSQVRKQLSELKRWNPAAWKTPQLGAFAIAAEEVSHFNYFVHHRSMGRAVSQLELELQGELDKFLLTLFSGHSLLEGQEFAARFEGLLDQFFERYRLVENLDEEQKARYREASDLAKRFLLKHRESFLNPSKRDTAFRLLRRFYRLNLSDKLTLTHR
jgi:hypothetical protein